MEMSNACTAPVQPAISNNDLAHDFFPQYQRYRNALASQLVTVMSFKSWLYQHEQTIEIDYVNNHKRSTEWRLWLRTNAIFKPGYVMESFHHWLGTH